MLPPALFIELMAQPRPESEDEVALVLLDDASTLILGEPSCSQLYTVGRCTLVNTTKHEFSLSRTLLDATHTVSIPPSCGQSLCKCRSTQAIPICRFVAPANQQVQPLHENLWNYCFAYHQMYSIQDVSIVFRCPMTRVRENAVDATLEFLRCCRLALYSFGS